MKLQKFNASIQSFAPKLESLLSLPLTIGFSWLAATSSLGLWVIAIYLAIRAVFISFHERSARLQKVKDVALKTTGVVLIYFLLTAAASYAILLKPFVFLIAICVFVALLFVCFKIYRSFFYLEKVGIRAIPDESSKPTLFINSQ